MTQLSSLDGELGLGDFLAEGLGDLSGAAVCWCCCGDPRTLSALCALVTLSCPSTASSPAVPAALPCFALALLLLLLLLSCLSLSLNAWLKLLPGLLPLPGDAPLGLDSTAPADADTEEAVSLGLMLGLVPGLRPGLRPVRELAASAAKGDRPAAAGEVGVLAALVAPADGLAGAALAAAGLP